jgi:hypothetical protein
VPAIHMNERTKAGLQVLQVAMVLGILGDVLLRATPWGLNVLLFNLAFVGGAIMLLWRHSPEYLTRQTLALFGALIFFASMFVWRDAIELRVADTFAIVAIMSVIFVPRMKVAASVAGLFQYAAAFVWSALNAAFAPFILLGSDIKWKAEERTGWTKNLFAVLRGIAIATPLLVIFGALFVAADAVYEGMVQHVLNVPFETVFSHVLLTGFLVWLSAGYLRGLMFTGIVKAVADTVVEQSTESKIDQVRAESVTDQVTLPDNLSILEHINISDPPSETRPVGSVPKQSAKSANAKWSWAKIENTAMPPVFTLGVIEVGVILGLMNLLFLSFVIVQVPYLFGGMELVQNTPDFKLAEYARRGFGELVAVSALVLPTLLIGHWLIRREDKFAGKLSRILAGSQIVLLFVIMASAVQRLVLLTGNLGYGMTTIRLYPLIFMIWLAIVFVWFGLTVMRGVRQHFAWGALWSAFFVLGATHVLNPDEFIVKTNLALMSQGRSFDAHYYRQLSDAVVPPLLESLDSMSAADRKVILDEIGDRYCKPQRNIPDFRNWNFDRWNSIHRIESSGLSASLLQRCVEEDVIESKPE